MTFRYTVDYPKIELHPFDTKKFSILYNDTCDPESSGQPSAIDQFTVNLQQDRNNSEQDNMINDKSNWDNVVNQQD